MAMGTGAASVTAFALSAPGCRNIRTCPTSMDGATPVEDNVRLRMSLDVVWGGTGTGTVSLPTRRRTGDGGGRFFAH